MVISLLDTISRCSCGEQSWQDFLDQLRFFCPALKLGITGYDHEQKLLNFALLSGYDPDYIHTYNDYFFKVNPWIPALGNAPLPPNLLWAYDALPDTTLKKTAFYNDWVFPQEDAATGFAIGLIKSQDRFITMNCNINYKYMAEAQCMGRVLQTIGSSLQRGFEVWRRLQGQAMQITTQTAALNRMTVAIFILDENQKITFANKKADKILQHGDVVKTDSAKQLYFVSNADQNAVFPQLGKNAHIIPSQQTQPHDGYIRLIKPAKTPYLALVSRFEHPEDHAIIQPTDMLRPPRQNILMLINPSAEKKIDEAAIMASFGLTPAQAKTATCLVRGMTLKESASHNDIAYSTAKCHLKNATETMGINSQSQLILRLTNLTILD